MNQPDVSMFHMTETEKNDKDDVRCMECGAFHPDGEFPHGVPTWYGPGDDLA